MNTHTDYDPQHPRKAGRPDLAGRLMPVKIIKTHNRNGIGELPDNDRVFITNGARVLNPQGECLVKFDNSPGTMKGNFVSSGFPEGISGEGLASEKYILYGTWRSGMRKGGFLPSLSEVNDYYDPGQVLVFPYLSVDWGAFAIHAHRPPKFLSGINYERIIAEYLPDPMRASRLVIGDSPSMLRGFGQECKRQGIRLFKMDNLVYNWITLRRQARIRRLKQEGEQSRAQSA